MRSNIDGAEGTQKERRRKRREEGGEDEGMRGGVPREL